MGDGRSKPLFRVGGASKLARFSIFSIVCSLALLCRFYFSGSLGNQQIPGAVSMNNQAQAAYHMMVRYVSVLYCCCLLEPALQKQASLPQPLYNSTNDRAVRENTDNNRSHCHRRASLLYRLYSTLIFLGNTGLSSSLTRHCLDQKLPNGG